jgi:hypothetical protein
MDAILDASQSSLQQVVLFVPVMTREKFAELTGLPLGVVRGLIGRGSLMTVRLGKRNLVNVALLNKIALEREF